MLMQRRGLLTGLGIALAMPALVRAESLMRISLPKKKIVRILISNGSFIIIDKNIMNKYIQFSIENKFWHPDYEIKFIEEINQPY